MHAFYLTGRSKIQLPVNAFTKQMKYIFLTFSHLPCNMEILREIYFGTSSGVVCGINFRDLEILIFSGEKQPTGQFCGCSVFID